MKPIHIILPFLVVLSAGTIPTAGETTSALSPQKTPASVLAIALQQEGHHRSAAVEWRRLALHAESPDEKAGYYWAAAYQYLEAMDPVIAEKMLDAAELASWDIEMPALILRAQAATQQHNPQTAAFYWDTIRRSELSTETQKVASQQLAAISVKTGNMEAARQYLEADSSQNQAALQALESYQQHRDKSPRIGGLLGIIPGMGYAYAGEYGNAVRSIILNTIFLFGMIHTAEEDQWGAFAAITFFELTWYSGSIYGGIDATHRHNRQRQTDLMQSITGSPIITPDWNNIPQISLHISF